jgi:glucose/arabinose dehydrogenase
MIRRALLLTGLIVTACSGSPEGLANAQATMRNSVPPNSPLEPGIRNVPATTGRANLPIAPAPFTVTDIGKFDSPFAMAFLPGDQGLLVTEKAGKLKLRQPDGKVVDIAGVPRVAKGGQGGLLDVAVAPTFVDSHIVYLSYAEPGAGGSALALARAKLDLPGRKLDDVSVIWRSGSNGPGGQFGSIITFRRTGDICF